jgi:hypothetical protein
MVMQQAKGRTYAMRCMLGTSAPLDLDKPI